MTHKPVQGVIVPTVTPFDDHGAINPSAIPALAHYLIDHGVAGLFPLGTTGEGVLLSTEERKTIATAFVKAVESRVPVIVHTGAITTQETIDLTRHARDIGAQAVAVVPPFYFQHSDAALEQHFDAIASAVPDFPIYLYNFPAVSNNTLSLDLVKRLADEHDNIVGLKDSSGDLQTLFAVQSLHDGRFNTAVGPDELILAALSMGVDATVSGHANLVPEIVVGIYNAVAGSRLDEARQLQGKLNAVRAILAEGGWLPAIKGMMAHRGVPVGGVRRPLVSASDDVIESCVRKLNELDVPLK